MSVVAGADAEAFGDARGSYGPAMMPVRPERRSQRSQRSQEDQR
ncbi:MAG: hypothetical protein ACRDJN_27595 [Chloroflexota bacterium]